VLGFTLTPKASPFFQGEAVRRRRQSLGQVSRSLPPQIVDAVSARHLDIEVASLAAGPMGLLATTEDE